MNFFMLVPARLDLPVIANPYPNRLLQVTNTFSFNVTSASATIPTNGIHLTLNGVDVSSSLVVSRQLDQPVRLLYGPEDERDIYGGDQCYRCERKRRHFHGSF